MTAYTPAPGDFGVTQIRGWVGWLVRLGQWLLGDGWADFEHAFVYVGDGMVVEGQPGGARRTPLSRYDTFRVEWYQCPPTFGPAVAGAALALVGTPYSFADYLALAAVRLHLPIGQRLRRYVAASGHLLCSQLVDEAYRRGGVHLFTDDRLPGDVTPGDLYDLIVARRRAIQPVKNDPQGAVMSDLVKSLVRDFAQKAVGVVAVWLLAHTGIDAPSAVKDWAVLSLVGAGLFLWTGVVRTLESADPHSFLGGLARKLARVLMLGVKVKPSYSTNPAATTPRARPMAYPQ